MLETLLELLTRHPHWTVLTGAGISTGSGIPDYRDASGAWKRPSPVTLQAFMGGELVRQRYWARSLIGWPLFNRARPNGAHDSLARLEAMGCIAQVVTQNVDGLHQLAGSHRVVDLHGRLDTVICMQCTMRMPRSDWQTALIDTNPHWDAGQASIAPDGDADLDGIDFSSFVVPGCPHCRGVIKPDVVFYGENVPSARVASAMKTLEHSGALLVIGSSLMVYSGLRFVNSAKHSKIPVVAVNLGITRADAVLDLKVSASCEEVLASMENHWGTRTTTRVHGVETPASPVPGSHFNGQGMNP